MSFQEAVSDSRIEMTMDEYEKLNMSAFNRPTGGITLDDLQETMLEGTGSEKPGLDKRCWSVHYLVESHRWIPVLY